MKLTLTFTNNNITYNNNDSLLITFDRAFKYVKSIDDIFFTFDNIQNESGYNIYVRWSIDSIIPLKSKDRFSLVYSAWESIMINNNKTDNFNNIFNSILKNTQFHLQFKLVRYGDYTGSITLNSLDIKYTPFSRDELPETAPLSILNEICPTTSNICLTENTCSGVILNCNSSDIFRVYDYMGPAVNLVTELSCIVGEVAGHCVRYFKTDPKLETGDAVLKEYSLFNVTDVKDIKILVKGNEFPDNSFQFTQFDMEFQDSIEIHIIREHFQRAFGLEKKPEEKDYIYFPLMDRMYEISSAYLVKDFMMKEYYYKAILYKWQDKVNVMRDNPEINEYVDNLVDNFDEILQEDVNDDIKRVTKPLQYNIISVGGNDHIRSHINNDLEIKTDNILNYYTVIAKYYYNIPTVPLDELVVKYKLKVDRKLNENTSFSFWFNLPLIRKNSINDETILQGYDENTQKGYKITINWTPNYNTNDAIINNIKVKLNDNEYIYDNINPIKMDNWYGFVLNHMNNFEQLSLFLWEMQYNLNNPSQNRSTKLKLLYTKNHSITKQDIILNDTYQIKSGHYYITNIRIWKESIEEEKQPIILNQYVVKDTHLSLLIDNAIPPLKLVKEFIR